MHGSNDAADSSGVLVCIERPHTRPAFISVNVLIDTWFMRLIKLDLHYSRLCVYCSIGFRVSSITCWLVPHYKQFDH